MPKLKSPILALLFIFLTVQGCAYLHVRVPLDKDVQETQLGEKMGYASMHSVMGMVSWGDAGTEAAAKDGDLKVINHLDREYYMLLFGLYSRSTTIAYGD